MRTSRTAIRFICFAYGEPSAGVSGSGVASIESPGTGERQSFANLAQLSAYLGEQCERQPPEATELPGT